MAELPAYSPTAPTVSLFPSTELPSYSAVIQVAPGSADHAILQPHSPTSRFTPVRPTFTVGKKQTPALITPADVKAHLALLRAFNTLRDDVFSRGRKSSSDVFGPEEAWTWFLSKAVWRFEMWMEKVIRSSRIRQQEAHWSNFDEIPPVDVLMIWHTYLLHPRTYYEDGLRMHPGLLARGSFPLHEAARIIEHDGASIPLPGSPSQLRAYLWESNTGQPWQAATSPADEGVASGTFTVHCPSCEELINVEWLNDRGSGWAQAHFSVDCTQCGTRVTKEVLGVLKFCKDLRAIVAQPKRHTLATMLLDEFTGKPFAPSTATFHLNLVENLSITSFSPSAAIFAAHQMKWSMTEVQTRCRIGFRTASHVRQMAADGITDIGLKGLQSLLGAYVVPGPYSIDLVAAVQRQMKFVDDMVNLGWTSIGRFENEGDESSMVLKRAISQYHAFLDVMYYHAEDYLVPTLSIDLAWHTHQLLCTEYRESTLSLIGLIVNHDDSVEHETVAAAFEQTSTLWSKKHGVPYTVCGCPVGGKGSAPTKPPLSLSKLISRKGKAKAKSSDSKLVNPRPDLLSATDPHETHPSEHPATFVTNLPSADAHHITREKAATKQLAEDEEAVSLGTATGWQELAVQVRHANGARHHAAFTVDKDVMAVADGKQMGIGNCVAGIGRSGKCVAGNKRERADPVREWNMKSANMMF